MIEDFIFDGKKLSEFGYIICSFDNSELETTPTSKITYTTIKTSGSDITHKVATDYDDTLTRVIDIIKLDCKTENYTINNYELSELSKWLCRKDYKWFRWIDTVDDDEIFYEVKIDIQQIRYDDNRIGLQLIITANRPYGVTKEIVIKRNMVANTPTNIMVYNTDEEGYIYPDIKIVLKQDGDLTLANSFENNYKTFISGCKNNEIINIYGNKLLQIVSSLSNHKLYESFNYKFPRLCNFYGKSNNTITSSLNCDIEIKYRGVRKVGI